VAVPGPGEVATGPAEIRDMLKGWLAEGRISVKHKALHQVGDTALEILEWTLAGTDPTADPASGLSATVIKRQPDGRWRMQIDNCFILD
jgi:ketosteroid isomerase-like protein